MEHAAADQYYNRRNIIVAGIILSGIIAVVFVLGIIILNQDTIYAHVNIGSADVSRLTKDEAKQKLEGIYEQKLQGFRTGIVYSDNYWSLEYKEDIGYTYLYDKSIEEAYKIGRQGNIFERLKTIYNLRNNPVNITLKASYDASKLDSIIEEIKGSISKDSKDAVIRRIRNTFVISKEQEGIAVDVEALKADIMNRIEAYSEENIIVPVKTEMPRITAEELNVIQDVIGEFSTVFNPQVQGRTTNISIAANSIDGVVVMPDEEFSFNKQTGPRGIAEGYQEAPVVIRGELVPGIGGGICQVSTTLYNAVVRAGLEVTRRQNHSIPSTYVPIGHDATVVYGSIDFRFANNSGYPIYIESFKRGNRVHVKIYSRKTQNMSIDMQSQIIETIEPEVTIKEDPALYIGEKKYEKEAKKGFRVNTYKIYSENGNEVKRELISKDYYPPVHGILLKGTKYRPDTENIPDDVPVEPVEILPGTQELLVQ